MMIKNGAKANDLKLMYNREFNFISDLLKHVNLPSEKTDEFESDPEDEEELGEEIGEKNRKNKSRNRIKKLKTKVEAMQREKKVLVNSPTEDKKVKLPKPIFNGNGNLVFSKFDFLGETTSVVEKEILTNDTGNTKRILDKFEKKKNFIKKLEEVGEVEKANTIKEESAWKNAFRKAEGLKVKDDPVLLKKSVTKKESKKKASQKKWKERIRGVEKQKMERQKKRSENISKRVQEKKTKKLKKAVKKGRHIPKV